MKNFKSRLFASVLTLTCISACDFVASKFNFGAANKNLEIIIIRHAEKDPDGDNLSCQGFNRALAIPNVLMSQFNKPNLIYVPALKTGKSTKHARMLQTIMPMAVKYNLTVNSQFETDEFEKIAKNVQNKEGLVLMVWSHSEIKKLAKALGVRKAPDWREEDFDSIWVINYKNGQAQLSVQKENIQPPTACSF